VARHFATKLGTPKPAFFALEAATSVRSNSLGPHDANFFRVDFNALGERARVIAAVATALGPHSRTIELAADFHCEISRVVWRSQGRCDAAPVLRALAQRNLRPYIE
jgi:hypothetical protein